MKNLLLIINLFLLALMTSCDSKSKKTVVNDLDDDSKLLGICIWKEVSIKDMPSEKGKYLSTIYLGERFEVLEDTASELVKDRRYKYSKVKLTDGTEGWTLSQFVALNGIPAAFLKETTTYKRPDLMTATKKNFHTIDFVALINQTDDGWAEVIGKRVGDSWFTSGWVRNENLSYKKEDVRVSVLYTKAMEIKDLSSRTTELQTILTNSELQTSSLLAFISESLGDQEEGIEPEVLADSTASN
jgi:hypothetical protein